MTGYEGPNTKVMGPRSKSFTQQQLATVGDQLRPSYRAILARMIDGEEYKKIAADLNMPLGSVKSRGSRARAALQKLLDANKPAKTDDGLQEART